MFRGRVCRYPTKIGRRTLCSVRLPFNSRKNSASQIKTTPAKSLRSQYQTGTRYESADAERI